MTVNSAVRDNQRVFEIGASLREARIKRGLSSADVQKAIRIRDRYLQALEEERWELLPGDAYVKGFLRTYADFLGLDAQLYIDEYNSRFAVHDEYPLSPQPLARPESARRRGGLLWPAVAVAVVLAVIAVVVAWQLGGPPKSAQPPTTSTTQITTGTTSTTKHKKHKKPTPPVTTLPTRAVLVAARGDVWLELRSGSATGTVIYEDTLAQGHSLPVNLKSGPVWLDMGAPWNLDVHMGGKLVAGLPTHIGAVLLTRSGLKPS